MHDSFSFAFASFRGRRNGWFGALFLVLVDSLVARMQRNPNCNARGWCRAIWLVTELNGGVRTCCNRRTDVDIRRRIFWTGDVGRCSLSRLGVCGGLGAWQLALTLLGAHRDDFPVDVVLQGNLREQGKLLLWGRDLDGEAV